MFQIPEKDFLDMKAELQRLREENARLKQTVRDLQDAVAELDHKLDEVNVDEMND